MKYCRNTEERDSWVNDIQRETKLIVEGKSSGEASEELHVAPVWNPDKAARYHLPYSIIYFF